MLIALLASAALACCSDPALEEPSLASAGVVFAGRVVSTVNLSGDPLDPTSDVDVTFQTSAWWKGPAAESALVRVSSFDSCDRPAPRVGQQWVIFATADVNGVYRLQPTRAYGLGLADVAAELGAPEVLIGGGPVTWDPDPPPVEPRVYRQVLNDRTPERLANSNDSFAQTILGLDLTPEIADRMMTWTRDPALVAYLLDQGAAPITRYDWFELCRECIEISLASGATVSQGLLTVALSDPAYLQRLLAAGAEVNSYDADWFGSPLVSAVAHPEALELLLVAGADPNFASDGTPPLHFAARVGVAPVRRLLGAGADPMALDAEGRNALAAGANHPEVLEFLLGVGVRPQAGSAVIAALRAQNPTSVRLLLAAGVPTDPPGAGVGAIGIAASSSRTVELVPELIRAGFPFADDVLAVAKEPEILRMLLASGAPPRLVPVMRGRPELVAIALAAGADPNEAHGETTPLVRAAATSWGRYDPTGIEVLERLIAAGADLGATDAAGRTALQFAEISNHPAAAAYLRALEQEAPDTSTNGRKR